MSPVDTEGLSRSPTSAMIQSSARGRENRRTSLPSIRDHTEACDPADAGLGSGSPIPAAPAASDEVVGSAMKRARDRSTGGKAKRRTTFSLDRRTLLKGSQIPRLSLYRDCDNRATQEVAIAHPSMYSTAL